MKEFSNTISNEMIQGKVQDRDAINYITNVLQLCYKRETGKVAGL